jgi:hypothetical protein
MSVNRTRFCAVDRCCCCMSSVKINKPIWHWQLTMSRLSRNLRFNTKVYNFSTCQICVWTFCLTLILNLNWLKKVTKHFADKKIQFFHRKPTTHQGILSLYKTLYLELNEIPALMCSTVTMECGTWSRQKRKTQEHSCSCLQITQI